MIPRIASSIEQAVRFLLDRRNAAGWWTDFDTLAGSSTEWVSAFVALALARTGDDPARAVARSTYSKLRRRRWWSAGWGFNGTVPADADSTTWVLRLATALGARTGRRPWRFLSRHITAAGALTTYARANSIRAYTRVFDTSFAGWCGEHACVTAAAAALTELPQRDRVMAWLRSAQQPDGAWTSYWWSSRHYTTALAAEALADAADQADTERVARAARWAAADLARRDAVSPFDRAFAARTLLLRGDDESIARAQIEQLVDEQRPDGSWTPSARLRIPPPDVVDPDRYDRWFEGGGGGGSIQSDRNACFTTAAVLMALCGAKSVL